LSKVYILVNAEEQIQNKRKQENITKIHETYEKMQSECMAEYQNSELEMIKNEITNWSRMHPDYRELLGKGREEKPDWFRHDHVRYFRDFYTVGWPTSCSVQEFLLFANNILRKTPISVIIERDSDEDYLETTYTGVREIVANGDVSFCRLSYTGLALIWQNKDFDIPECMIEIISRRSSNYIEKLYRMTRKK